MLYPNAVAHANENSTMPPLAMIQKPDPLPRASHTNSGTSIPRDELPWPERPGTVLGHRKLHLEHDERPDITIAGGLVLPLALAGTGLVRTFALFCGAAGGASFNGNATAY